MTGPRVLMTLDAVGGVWRYALDLALGLRARGAEIVLAGLGPEPSSEQRAEAQAVGPLEWGAAPLDWMADGPEALAPVAPWLDGLAARHDVDLLHLNLPTQAVGLSGGLPVVTVSHSCLATWFAAVRQAPVPSDMDWHRGLTAQGLAAADLLVVPTRAHGDAVARIYAGLPPVAVVPNASQAALPLGPRRAEVTAVGRWWDDGKNGAILDAAAAGVAWPVTMIGATQGPNGAAITLHHARSLGSMSHNRTLGHVCRTGILCAPSLYEPFGLAILEAARAATPLVLADIPTFRELWQDAAVFFDPRDPAALAAALNALAQDGQLRAQLGQAACQRANRYLPQQQTAAMMRLYDGLVAPRVSARTATG